MPRDRRHGDQQARSNKATREALRELARLHQAEYDALLVKWKAVYGVTPQPRQRDGRDPILRLVERFEARND